MYESKLTLALQTIAIILSIIFCFWILYDYKEDNEYVEKNIHKYPQCSTATNVCKCIRLLEAIEYLQTEID